MLIRVIPLPPLPTILFTITFPNLTRDLPMPPYWDVQLQRLAAEDLEIPHSIHSLDKAAWIAALLQEVTFDMTSLTVSALFVDHSVEEWPLMGRECVSALESVLRDVNDSALESEQERADAPPQPPPAPLPPPVQAKHSKHKKQRSLLMSLVACVSSLERQARCVTDRHTAHLFLRAPRSLRRHLRATPYRPRLPHLVHPLYLHCLRVFCVVVHARLSLMHTAATFSLSLRPAFIPVASALGSSVACYVVQQRR